MIRRSRVIAVTQLFVPLLLLASLSVLTSVAHGQPIPLDCAGAQEGPSYPLYCRGPLSLGTSFFGQSYEILYVPNPTAAGSVGQTLRPGSCAWADRPLNPLEASRPLELFAGSAAPPLFHMVNRCVGDSTCVIVFCAHGSSLESQGGLFLDEFVGATLPH
jgi:hypothetical protein